jgi:hypothetical protein
MKNALNLPLPVDHEKLQDSVANRRLISITTGCCITRKGDFMKTSIPKAFRPLICLCSIPIARAESSQCQEEYNKLAQEILSANYCSQASDCKVLGTTRYIKFGCYHYINKDTDLDGIYREFEATSSRCEQVIDECDSPPSVRCVNKKCLSKEK